MATPKVYVICDQNCKFEGMTKEQIYTAIIQAVNEGTIGNIDTGFVQTIKTINGQALRFFVGTQAEYDALTDEDKENLFAIITNDTIKADILEAIAELQADNESIRKSFEALQRSVNNVVNVDKELSNIKNDITNLEKEVENGISDLENDIDARAQIIGTGQVFNKGTILVFYCSGSPRRMGGIGRQTTDAYIIMGDNGQDVCLCDSLTSAINRYSILSVTNTLDGYYKVDGKWRCLGILDFSADKDASEPHFALYQRVE